MKQSLDSASQLELLHRISGIVGSSLTLEKMLEELVALVFSITFCDACLVYLVDEPAGEIVLCASQLPHAKEIGQIRMKIGEGVTGWVAKHRSVVALSAQASLDPRFKTFSSLPEDTYEAFLSVPIVTSGEVIGVINVHHWKPRNHSPEEVALVGYVAEQMGGAIAKAEFQERSKSASRKVELLAILGETVANEGFLDRILQTISEMVAQTFDSPLCSIMMVDEDRRELAIKAARCSAPEYLNRMPIRIEDSLIGRVVREGKLVIVEDVRTEKLYRYPELARKAGLASLLSVPLLTSRGVIGTLNIYLKDRKTFTKEETLFAQAIAGQAAMALENARLISESLEMKRTLEARKIVERAKGILQQRDGITEEEAYLHLRSESRRMRRPMRNLAEAIILAEELHRKSRRKNVSDVSELREHSSKGLEPEESAFDEGYQN